MKTNIFIAAMSLLTITAVAQKDEIKNAEDAIEDGQYAEAKAQLKIAEPNLANVNDKWQERFYLFKGRAYVGTGAASSADMMIAAEAFQKAAEMGNDEANQGLANLRNTLIQSAIDDQNNKKFKASAEKLYTSYQLSKQDTMYLYYAANTAVQAKDYDMAIGYLETLNELDYDGSGTEYVAVNIETEEEEVFGSKNERDLMVKTNQYKNPSVREIPSKKGEIAGLIARIYIDQKKFDKAIDAMEEAKASNPGDMSLLQSEANMYYQMGNKEKARETLEEVAENNNTDPVIFNNIGLMYAENGNIEKAKENYKKALEVDNSYNEARLNLVAAILSNERKLIDEMNGLGMSKKDNERYDELDAERKELYNEVVPHLEAAIEIEPDNMDAVKAAMNIYSNLGNQEKVEEMKAKLAQ